MQNPFKTITFPNNKNIDRIEIFHNPFKLNIFFHKRYAGRITENGEFPEGYLSTREALTSIARRIDDKYLHIKKDNVVTIHENHYDPKAEKKVYNPKDLNLYHLKNGQFTEDGRFWYHIHIDFNTKINYKLLTETLDDLKYNNIISKTEYNDAKRDLVKNFQDNINISTNEIIRKEGPFTTTSSKILELDNLNHEQAFNVMHGNNQHFEYSAEQNAQYSKTPAKPFKLPDNIAVEEAKAIGFLEIDVGRWEEEAPKAPPRAQLRSF